VPFACRMNLRQSTVCFLHDHRTSFIILIKYIGDCRCNAYLAALIVTNIANRA
jgi:hypothetical protein